MTEQESKEAILSHYRATANRRELELPHLKGHMVNRSCGDEVTLYARMENGLITYVSYTGNGCSICIASADMLCAEMAGRDVAEARDIAQTFLNLLGGSIEEGYLPGDLPALLSLRNFPMRQKCAIMGWKILLDIIG